MNNKCYNALMKNKKVTVLCKSWLWMHRAVFSNKKWRSWEIGDDIIYPFYDPQFIVESPPIPPTIWDTIEVRLDFYSCCEHWFECCCTNNKFEIQNGLPFSDGGLGLIVRTDAFYEELEDNIFGVLEFVNQELFHFLMDNDYPSLYTTQEMDYCIVIGPISLCNNGRTNLNIPQYPSFKDRDFLSDEELMYKSFRKEFSLDSFPQLCVWIEFQHNMLKMHNLTNLFLTTGDQIMVDYGFVTSILVDLTV